MKRTIVLFFLGIFSCLSIKALELDEPDVGITDFDENEGKTEDQLEEAFEIFQRGAVYDAQSGKRRYDNYQVISVNPQTEEHLDVLQFLEGGKQISFLLFYDGHELWNLCTNKEIVLHFNVTFSTFKSPSNHFFGFGNMRFSALVRFSTRTSSHAIKRYNVTVTIEFLLDYGFALMQTVDYAMQTLIQPKTV